MCGGFHIIRSVIKVFFLDFGRAGPRFRDCKAREQLLIVSVVQLAVVAARHRDEGCGCEVHEEGDRPHVQFGPEEAFDRRFLRRRPLLGRLRYRAPG